MSELEDKAVELLDKMDMLATQYTPEVIEKAVSAVSVTATGEIIGCVAGIALAVMLALASKYWFKFFMRLHEKEGDYNDWNVGAQIGVMVGGIISIVVLTGSTLNLFNIWMWVAIWNPELALAHKVLGL